MCTVIYFLAALHLAHRALVAALIFANPAAEIRRLPALIGTTLWPFVFAQRAFCAAEIFARADALILRGPRDPPRRSNPLRAVIAVSSAFNCPAIFALSSFNCEMMSMVPPRGEDCNRVPAILRANHCNPNRTLRLLASIAAQPERFSRETGDYTSIRQIASKVFGWVWAMLFPDGRWMDAFHGHSPTVCIRSTALQPSWKNRGLGRRHGDHKISLFLLICSRRGA